MIQSTGTLSRAALQRRWSEWRSEVVRRRKAGDFIALPELDLLAAVSVCVCVCVESVLCEDVRV